MNPTWYLNRLKKMSAAEIFKRVFEAISHYASRIKYMYPEKWPYERFADQLALVYHNLPYAAVEIDCECHWIYNHAFNLKDPVDWHFSDVTGKKWPAKHYSTINYRPGNPYGDVRINWELNRLQFLPFLAVSDEDLAKAILLDWLRKNPYQHGPAYLSSMEVAIRWISIYRTACTLKDKIDTDLEQNIVGLAIASGKFIESHLSTYSSAGNHLIVEALGLFWLGRALDNRKIGQGWITKARKILHDQICRQINPDGTNQEQTFWYLGFVIDAVFHYFLLEEQEQIPVRVNRRIKKSLELIHDFLLGENQFPDYGDRDDGYIFHLPNQYHDSPFSGLLNIGAFYYEQDKWSRSDTLANQRLSFWTDKKSQPAPKQVPVEPNIAADKKGQLKTYPDGGMTWMQQGRGKLLFRHAPLGRGTTRGHGHADALSIVLSWNETPLLIDLGSGQYNGDQTIRNYFRSTIAHNTVEAMGQNQARMLGPFMWDQTYQISDVESGVQPYLFAQAAHNGYEKPFSLIHKRRIEWKTAEHIRIEDAFAGASSVKLKGTFHLGPCKNVTIENQQVTIVFDNIVLFFQFPFDFSIDVYYGSKNPFLGWCSDIYGKWKPIHTILFSMTADRDFQYAIDLKIIEKKR